MDHPVKEIRPIIRSLTQGTPAEQQKTLDTYFTPDAAFVHPFCRVPSFPSYALPFLSSPVNSRLAILLIYRWYRILSPHIEIDITSAVHDQKQNLLYLQITQAFTFFFLPFYTPRINLTTVLRLDHRPAPPDARNTSGGILPIRNASGSPGPENEAVGNGNGNGNGNGTGKERYYITAQEDLYQTTEWLKFLVPWVGAPLFAAWQLFAALLSVAGAVVLAPLTWLDVGRGEVKGAKEV
ncbi:hypothetical protein ACHAQA_005613 [Verticillium albo-atrum]